MRKTEIIDVLRFVLTGDLTDVALANIAQQYIDKTQQTWQQAAERDPNYTAYRENNRYVYSRTLSYSSYPIIFKRKHNKGVVAGEWESVTNSSEIEGFLDWKPFCDYSDLKPPM